MCLHLLVTISILRVIEPPFFSALFFFPLEIYEQKTVALLALDYKSIVMGRVYFSDNFVIQR
jgi:hypothetical protein